MPSAARLMKSERFEGRRLPESPRSTCVVRALMASWRTKLAAKPNKTPRLSGAVEVEFG